MEKVFQPDYVILRSNRRTLEIEIKDGAVIVRAPRWATQADVNAILEKNQDWIAKHLQKAAQQARIAASAEPLRIEELCLLADLARKVIPERVRYYAPLVGVNYGRITIRNQRSKWGSCSSKGNLNFNCLLMLTPQEVLDSVIVHELCHRKEMNHSEHFYAEVLRVYPEYKKWNRWLKDNGPALMQRMQAGLTEKA